MDVLAGVEGTVTFTGGGDDTVAVETEDGERVRYLHLARIDVGVGEIVHEDTIVGQMGGTPIHLHLDMQDPEGNWVDPQNVEWGEEDLDPPPRDDEVASF